MAVNPDAITHKTANGSVISFHDIVYTVDTKKGCCGPKKNKVILHNVNGIFKPGMNAIMGPTGSGKTSLLDVLAGRKDPTGLQGQVLVDGNPQPKNFKCMTGYVVQDDVVMGTLTVRENFMFSANVRLPSTVTKEEKKKRVNAVITELGLTHCADSKVGTPFIRGVSGGERKRTNIGMELIISPSVLFLDEPTTGLDASTSHAVLHLLNKLASKGRTVIFSIHQPRYSIYKLFDSLMLLSHGETVYHGPSAEGLEYFNSIGHECEEHDNPADFFLDVVNGDSSAVQGMKNASPVMKLRKRNQILSAGSITVVDVGNKDNENSEVKENGKVNGHGNGHVQETEFNEEIIEMEMLEETDEQKEQLELSLAQQLHEKYQASNWYSKIKEEIEPIYNAYSMKKKSGEVIEVAKGQYATNFLSQFNYVSRRTVLSNLRNPMVTIVQIMIMIMLGLIVGGLFFDLDDTLVPGLQNRVGLFFFIIMNQVFSNISSVELFIRERAIFVHENASGFYRVSAYFFAKVFCDFIPLRIFPNIAFSCVVYFMTGLTLDAGKYFFFFLVLLLTTLTAASIGFFWGATIGVFAVANLFIALTFVLMMIFGGLFVNIDSIWVGIRWIQYFSLFRYSLSALSINEIKGLEFYSVMNGTKISVGFGDDLYLEDQSIDYETHWDLWKNILALGVMIIGFLFLAYVQLRRIPKYK